MIFATTLILFMSSVILLALYSRYNRSTRLIKKIPGPKAWPIIGNSLSYALPSDKLFKYQRSLAKIYGDVNQIHGLNVNFVHISNPKDIEKILSSAEYNFKLFPYSYLSAWLGDGLLISNGKKWHQRRKLLTKSFHFNILKKFLMTFVDVTENFVKQIEQEVGKTKTDLFPLMNKATLRIMCETAMGIPVQEHGIISKVDSYFKSIDVIGDIFTKRISRGWLQLEKIFQLTSTKKLQDQAVSDLHRFTNTVIKERRQQLTKRLNQFDDNADNFETNEKFAMLDMLLQNEKAGNIDIDGIREEVDTFMFEGHDTTAVALTYMLMALANEPDIQDKIYEEMRGIFGDSDRLPTMDDLNEMNYLECCIKETLRLYPSVAMIMRCLTKDTVLGGYTVPEGAYIFICIYDVHRRADVYPDPERFIPDRFFPENCSQRDPYAYIPFSAGVRNCIGQKFALLEMKVIMSRILRKFHLEPVTKPSDMVYKTDLVVRTTHPIYAKFCIRQ